MKSETHSLASKIPKFKYMNIVEVIGNQLELAEVLVKRLTEMSKVLLSAFVSTPSPDFPESFWEVFWRSVGSLWPSAGDVTSHFCHEAPPVSLWL